MTIVPSSDIILLKTPFEMDERNQLTFSNKQAQFNYFNSLPKLEYDRCTYQRKEGVIRYTTEEVGLTFEDLLEYNYCMYKNKAYSDKWFYAYIESIEYKNDGMSEVKIKTDAFQTWQFDLSYKRSFIEREHVSNDTIGLHTIPEQLEHGEYINAQDRTDFIYTDTCYIVIATTERYTKTDDRPASSYNGIYSGLIYQIFKSSASANAFLYNLDQAGRGGIVESVFMISSFLAPDAMLDTYSFSKGNVNYQYFLLHGSSEATDFGTIRINRPNHVGINYVPVNNKLYCWPYNYFVVSNNVGTNAEYHYENFSDTSNMTFQAYGDITPGCSIKAVPKNYKGVQYNFEESINGAKLPVCSWNTDVYTNWLTQNSVNIGLSYAKSGTSALLGVLTLNPGSILSGIYGVADKQAEIYEHSFTPNQARGNTNSGDVVFSTGNSDLSIYYVTIKNEYAKIIDNFFSMFGYKVNEVKTPILTGRRNWNYLKTVDINITGDIPQADLQEIKDMFNAGCTFWHNPNTFLDYSQSNPIV